MNAKAILAIILGVTVLTLAIAIRPARTSSPGRSEPEPAAINPAPVAAESSTPRPTRELPRVPHRADPEASERDVISAVMASIANEPTPAANKLERLTRIREAFRTLASGNPTTALRAVKQLPYDAEREAALTTLVEQWTLGEVASPGERASRVATFGMQAGLGLELCSVNPQLALQWADELTTGPGRLAIFQQAATIMLGSDPAAAFALSDHLPPTDRRQFTDGVFAQWGARDTSAALQWVEQLTDPAEHDAALKAIRTMAPVGIGTALAVKDGIPFVANVLPGTPAELSQIQPGDRIVGLAQGNNQFIDARSVSLADLAQMIRGAPGSVVQLQILPADAPPDSQPRTVSITRDQIKFKR